ncbi:MAG: histidine--tRNA ligase [Halobacteriovoraceae bacterium]|nr:histidine--tRNA ligase [Halobacteriovoraceae bacterium]
MTLSKKPYKGTRDFFPPLKRAQNYLFQKMQYCAESFGYENYTGPLLEEVDLYRAKSGEELINDQIYSFIDRGKREVAIRPEMTPTLARMVASIHREESKPLRWYSIPNVYRYERPQKGRLREHWQLNCDIFGAPELYGEAEIIQVAVNLMKSFGATEKHFQIYINDRQAVDALFKSVLKADDELAYKLYKLVDRSKKIDRQTLEKDASELGLSAKQREDFLSYIDIKEFSQLAELLKKNGQTECAERLTLFMSLISNLGLDNYVTFDPAIVRGLDYYTGIVFEIFDLNPENPRAISGGGAYANLLQIFKEPALAGCGFGLGDVTLSDFLKTHRLLPSFDIPENDLFVTFQVEGAEATSLVLAAGLRSKGLKVLNALSPTKIKKVFSIAEKKGARFITLIGEDELKNQKVQVKNLQSKEQQEFNIDDIDSIASFLNK